MQQEKEKIFNYLNENTTSVEKEEVENWISESSENTKIFEEEKKLYGLTSIDEESFSPDVDRAWNKVSASLFASKDNKVIQMNFGFMLRIAAMLVLGIGLAYFFFQNTTDQNQIATLSGEIQQIELSDGTKIWVNENSTFKYPEEFSSDVREVYLDGEAYFEVAKNPEKPFVIRSANTFTQVLGTSFNLHATASKSEVDVVSGKVALVHNSDQKNKVVLTKGQHGALANGIVRKSENFDANGMAWKTKKIVFKSSNIEEVVSVLQDYYGVKIEYDTSIANCLITSTFEDKSLEEVFEVLKVIAGINNTVENGVYSLTGTGC